MLIATAFLLLVQTDGCITVEVTDAAARFKPCRRLAGPTSKLVLRVATQPVVASCQSMTWPPQKLLALAWLML